MRYLLVLLAFVVSACSSTMCRKMETRCADDVVQICDSRGRWQEVMDCRDIQPGGWTCEFDGVDHTCIEVVRHEANYNRDGRWFVASHGKVVQLKSYE